MKHRSHMPLMIGGAAVALLALVALPAGGLRTLLLGTPLLLCLGMIAAMVWMMRSSRPNAETVPADAPATLSTS